MTPLRAFTLVEIIIAIAVMAFAILGILNVTTFYGVQARSLMEHADCQAQLNFAAADIKLHLMSASSVVVGGVDDRFEPSGEVKNSLTFLGEQDVYTITPENPDNDVPYTYMLFEEQLIRRINNDPATDEVLVEARYRPDIEFVYTAGKPPNFITVTITGEISRAPLGKADNIVERSLGVRFWFIDIIRL